MFEEHFGMIDFDWGLKLFKNNASVEVCKPLYKRYVTGKENLSLNDFYRKVDFYYSLMTIEGYADQYPKEVSISYKRIHGTRARSFYMKGDMKNARAYFLKSELNIKTFLYYLSTFIGSEYVKKKFNVFG
jgi:hypothetical protein